ncbi:MAG TPA: RdgB/HAM1 family non-canonical purine NTP pyrophosphatase [Candidatus Obscuribacterales bacterium]
MRIVLATRNPGKLAELTEMGGQVPWLELVLAPEGFAPDETGKTFFENASIKARAAAKLTGLPALADDSGLVVEALDGKPGIQSARWCEGSDADRRAKLLSALEGVAEERRLAAFMCVMVLCDRSGNVLHSVIRAWPGRIGLTERGANGFGYDPIFYLLDRDITAAELSRQEKNRLSHRGQAWRAMLSFLDANQGIF